MGTTAHAKDVYLKAEAFDMTMPDGSEVPMWGFTECDSSWVCTDPPTAPGPQIDATTADTLTIHVNNTLPTPVSIVVPGQGGGGNPVFTTDGLGRSRVRSFTVETAAGATSSYALGAVDAGTYMYQSGTHPSIQVPMGLYGALVVTPASSPSCTSGTSAYGSADSCYDHESVLLFSEVDPWMNEAIDAAAGVVGDYPSTVYYNPSYFLINGSDEATLPAGDPEDVTLLRMLNAGLESHHPTLAGLQLGLLAEDGYAYPGLMRYRSSAFLAAGKTLDVLVEMPNADATYGMYDRSARNNYSHMAGGGLSIELEVGTGTPDDPTPTTYAEPDTYSPTEDTLYSGASVLGNDVGMPTGTTVEVFSEPAHGTLVMASDGTFTYDPDPNFAGRDSFVYRALSGGDAYPAIVTLNVSFENDAPVAADDGVYTNHLGADIDVAAPGVLGNDSDADGDELTAVLDTAPSSGTLTLNADGSFSYTGGTPGTTVTFEYHAEDDDGASSDTVTVTLEVQAVSGIVLTVGDPDGVAVTDYRWVVQEDTTFKVDPSSPPDYLDTLSANFHKSYMPVVAQGVGATEFATVALDPDKHYYVSVLPFDGGLGDGSGHTMGGAQIAPGASSVSVLVNKQPIPTARISVRIFEDTSPTNGAIDAGEAGLGGFQITLEDAGGRYGQNGGQMVQDAFGNNLTNALDCFDTPPPRGIIMSCPDGSVLIENLAPGKYGVTAAPPAGTASTWTQTSTIEGSRVIDAWVKAGEAPFFLEFGGPGPHAFIGFVDPETTKVPDEVPVGDRVNDITGNVTLLHDPRPPGTVGSFETGNYDGLSHTRAWVGLNSIGGDGPSYATVQADEDGNFEITGIPNGAYQLVVWDQFLDSIIAFQSVNLTGSGADLGAVPVNGWFTRVEHSVFFDDDEDGVWDAGEAPLAEQAITLRFRDGSVYQGFGTDLEGFLPFDQVFPFFNWMVAEVDYARFKPTGLTVTVDGGGDTTGSPFPGLMSLQDGSPRTETGEVLTQAFQNFPGQTSLFEWGKVPYQPGENGGISGIVYYASTRGENDPRLTAGDPWEPGVPGVTVRLYREVAIDFDGNTALSLVEETTTDSWDDSLPTGCPGEDASTEYVTDTLGTGELTRCYDGWRNWNQARPGVFDGGYAFGDLDPGTYVVEVVPPPGYSLVKEADLNVGYGDVFDMSPVGMMLPGGGMGAELPDMAMITEAMGPEPGIAQPPCVGALHTVPDQLSLFPDAESYTPYAGAERPLCDRKRVQLSDQGQAAADFHLFTPTPVAAQFTGLITDDLALETRHASPSIGEKWSPAHIPVSMRDMNGREVFRTYTDGFGKYNGVAVSTFSANLPIPSGYSPAMHSVCLNDPGDTTDLDPHRNPNYGTLCYTLQYMPGTTSYLDTPVLPQSAFAAGYSPVDCAQPDETPALHELVGGALVAAGDVIELTSVGTVDVPNPEFWGPNAASPHNAPTIARDYGFGSSAGTVTLDGTALSIVSWSDTSITATVPSGMASGSYQLGIARSSGVASVNTLTVTVGSETPITVASGGSIQSAIDSAAAGSLILVEPGVYEEQVIMWKPVRLQGAGAGSTVINALKRPTEDLVPWRNKVATLVDDGDVDLLPGQTNDPDLFGGGILETELGAGILVLAKDGDFDSTASRIDGFTVLNADVGGGIVANGYAHNLEISNNLVTRNSGLLHGGIRVGTPLLPTTGDGPFGYNTNVSIHHNAITRNGAIGESGAGGGVALATGSDDYTISDNFICGNFTSGDGAGIGHMGLSDNGLIQSNDILFNQSANAGLTRSGGGIFVGGEAPEPPFLSMGAGNVAIDSNRIQGNIAAAGHGGGIRSEWFNGRDIELDTASIDYTTQQLGTATDFDLFVLGDLEAKGGLAVNTAVGGDVAFPTNGNIGSWPQRGSTVLSVGGDLSVAGSVGWGGGDIEVGGSCATPGWWVWVTHSTITCGTTPFDAAAYGAEMTALSDTLANLAATGTTSENYYSGQVTLTGTSTDLNVFDLDLDALSFAPWVTKINGINVSAPSGSTVVVNVLGDTAKLFKNGAINTWGGISSADIVWNFNGGGDLEVYNVAVKGAILAPTTDVLWTGGNTNGTVVVRNLTIGAWAPGFNRVTFAGELPPTVGEHWYTLDITNNMVVNNVAGWSGAGISLQDTIKANIALNTIAHNDSTATVGALLNVGTGTSEPQPAGVASGVHAAAVAAVVDQDFSNPRLDRNVIWQNRAFSVDAAGGPAELVPALSPASVGDCPTGADYWDIGVLDPSYELDPRYSILTDGTGTNDDSDPLFDSAYCNGTREIGALAPIELTQVFEEGGNQVEVRYGPLSLRDSDYHIGASSPAIDYSPGAPYRHVDHDIDNDARTSPYDLGADEYTP